MQSVERSRGRRRRAHFATPMPRRAMTLARTLVRAHVFMCLSLFGSKSRPQLGSARSCSSVVCACLSCPHVCVMAPMMAPLMADVLLYVESCRVPTAACVPSCEMCSVGGHDDTALRTQLCVLYCTAR